jgi:hypothetical protein
MAFSSAGVLSGTPTATASGSITFTATNALGADSRALTLTVNAAAAALPTLTNSDLPDATKNVAYSYQLTYTNSPTIFTLITSDVVIGEETSVGLSAWAPAVRMVSNGSNYSVSTTATFSAPPGGGITAKGYPYIVGGAIQAVVITDPGQGYVSAPTITFSNVGSGAGAVTQTPIMGGATNGSFPVNISLNRSTGLFSGTELAGKACQFGVAAFNNVGGYVGYWRLNINPVPPYVIQDDPFFAVVGDAYSQAFTTTGATPVTWSSSGALPAGLSFNTGTGTISGTASAASTTTFTVTATNSEGSASKSVYITAYAKTASKVVPSDLTYLGSFRMPDATQLYSAGSSGRGSGITLSNKAGSFGNGTLYVAGISSTTLPVCEVNIPNLVNGYSAGSITSLNTATIAQNWADSIEGQAALISPLPGEFPSICSMLWRSDKLYISAGYFYDQLGTAYKTFSRSDNLSTTGSILGPAGITDGVTTSFRYYMGYLVSVPSVAQTTYSIPSMLSGGFVGSLGVLGSWGPSGVAFNPANLTSTTTVTGTKVLAYPYISEIDYSKSMTYLFGSPSDVHFSPNVQQNKWFNSFSSQYNGAAWISSTNKKAFLVFGRAGIGKNWYGATQVNQLAGSFLTDNGAFVNGSVIEMKPGIIPDPVIRSKGAHGYPYNVSVTAYDESELGAVINGSKNSWEARPYDSWLLSYPFSIVNNQNDIQGVAHDEANRKLYISIGSQDTASTNIVPLVHVYSYPA